MGVVYQRIAGELGYSETTFIDTRTPRLVCGTDSTPTASSATGRGPRTDPALVGRADLTMGAQSLDLALEIGGGGERAVHRGEPEVGHLVEFA